MTNSSPLSIWCHLSTPAGGLTSNVIWVVWRKRQRQRERERGERREERETVVSVGVEILGQAYGLQKKKSFCALMETLEADDE